MKHENAEAEGQPGMLELIKGGVGQEKADYDSTLMFAFTGRSGSTVITNSLASMGTARRIDEVFNDRGPYQNITQIQPASTLMGYLNGIYGRYMHGDSLIFKSNFSDLKPVIYHVDIDQSFPALKVVYLERHDKVLQAISLYRAIQSEQWHMRSNAEGGHPGEKVEVELDVNHVLRLKKHLDGECQSWEEFFQSRGINPYRIYYEDYCDNPDDTMRNLYSHVTGETFTGDISTNFVKLADDTSMEWRDIVVSGMK
jgi:LPS sulfotransferase NodH